MPGKILWVDDTPEQVEELAESLRDQGFEVHLVPTPSEAASLLAASPRRFLAVIVDLLMSGDTIMVPAPQGVELLETSHGLKAGITFGRWITRRWPDLNLIGVSTKADPHDPQVRWFKENTAGYFDKYTLFTSIRPLLLLLGRLVRESPAPETLKTFVIHGRDTTAKNEFIRFLETVLRIPDPIVLHEQPALGRSLLEELPASRDVFKLVFVLLAAKDFDPGPPDPAIFLEAGFFAAHCHPDRGKVLVLHRGAVKLQEPWPGLVCIDISQGLDRALDKIRSETDAFMPLLRRG